MMILRTSEFFRNLRHGFISVPALFLTGLVSLPASAAETPPVGEIFANSCSPGVQAEFHRGITQLHSFEYTETSKIFSAIAQQDPTCAMARWGTAMSLWHPLWARPSVAALTEGARLLDEASKLAATDRERAYISALKEFFSSTDQATHIERATVYEAKMNALYLAFPDDLDAVIFYALSVLATADPRDKSYAHQFKAAAHLNWAAIRRPLHPGVLHYTIHSYDYPGLAHLALDAAKAYAEAAPDSTHAQHMPSHIFTRMGLWERSLASNLDSTSSAVEYTKKAHLPGHYDEGLHSIDYLMYAMLQTGRNDEAKDVLTRLQLIKKTSPENFKVAFTFASSPARYALERRQWSEASNLELVPADFPWNNYLWAKAIHHFARGIGAARSDNLNVARQQLAILKTLKNELPATTLPYWVEEVQVQTNMVSAWIKMVEGETATALDIAAAAADREDAVDKHPVTPGEVLPARELYADMLQMAGRYARALENYQQVLKGSPNRLNALRGAGEAAHALQNQPLADFYAKTVSDQTDTD